MLAVYVAFFTFLEIAICQIIPETSDYKNFPLPFQLPQEIHTKQNSISFGGCKIIYKGKCPHPDINFFLYTPANPDSPEHIEFYNDTINLLETSFHPERETKLIIHGYNSDMDLSALVEIRKEYLKTKDYNVFTVDWSPLNQAPCYLAALINMRLVGECTSNLIQRIRELGATDIHVIGFSLGAHISNYISLNLRPFALPRITGLDPALPGFITANKDEKLDKTDAEFVDVYHTSAFLQGKAEESGHVDFYMNGGVIQPGCWAENRFFACNHHRAPLYFAESINSPKGFYGWPCPSYLQYLIGNCPIKKPQNRASSSKHFRFSSRFRTSSPLLDLQIQMGEEVSLSAEGVYLVITESVSPYAVGRYEGPQVEILLRNDEKHRRKVLEAYKEEISKVLEERRGGVVEGLFDQGGNRSLTKMLVDKIHKFVGNIE